MGVDVLSDVELARFDPILDRDLQAREPTLDHRAISGVRERGYHVFSNSLPNAQWFGQLYAAYDQLSLVLKANPALVTLWDKLVEQWYGANDNETFFCRVPPTFRDRAPRADKRNKEYLQFLLDFSTSRAFRDSELGRHPAVRRLFTMLEELHFICTGLFSGPVNALMQEYPAMHRRLVHTDRLSPVVIKLLRYNWSPKRFATNPHVDKSALSFLLHADDDEVAYRMAKGGTKLRYSDLRCPIQYPDADHLPNHAVLIAGACLQEIGVDDLPGTPHMVLPVCREQPRHSVVAFYLAPHLNTENMQTDVEFENDALSQIS
jgi:hypothetical protein